MKKICSVFLCFLLFAGCVFPLWASALSNTKTNAATDIPTVYVMGEMDYILTDKDDKKSERVYTKKLPDGALETLAKAAAGPLMKALITDDWQEFDDVVISQLTSSFSVMGMNEEGLPKNNAGYDCLLENSAKDIAVDGKYNLYGYRFMYDWRLDPRVIVPELDKYIKRVKEATGAQKVNLVGRCLGGSIVMTYLDTYGYDDVQSVAFYCMGMEGVDVIGAVFAGRLQVDGDALVRYMQENKYGQSEEFSDQLILKTVEILNTTHGIEVPLFMLKRIYQNVYEEVIPGVLLECFSSMPGYWTLVGDDYYADAKKLNFGGQEEKYAVLIEKIDDFHYNILNRAAEIVNNAVESGVRVYNIVKYGIQMLPVTENSNEQADYFISLRSASLGATAAKIGETLPDAYLAAAAKNGTADYISPDGVVDSSTGILKDHTWYINNLTHFDMPECVNLLNTAFFDYNGYMTVFDDPAYPQYLYCADDESTITPLTAPQKEEPTFLSRLLAFYRMIVERLQTALEKITDAFRK